MTGLQPIIISCPFGNYLRWPGTTPTLGSYTLERRAGWPKRAWRMLSTIRYYSRLKAWSNKLGLPSPGIKAMDGVRCSDAILSLYGFGRDDWERLWNMTLSMSAFDPLCHPLAFELNLSCPNVPHTQTVKDVESVVKAIVMSRMSVIAKLPPIRWMALASPLYDIGVRWFHCCNTMSTPGGGLSGKPLKAYSLWAIEDLRDRWGRGVRIIGGGGVTGPDDVTDYHRAGADHVAVASMLLNPFNWRKVKWLVERMNKLTTDLPP